MNATNRNSEPDSLWWMPVAIGGAAVAYLLFTWIHDENVMRAAGAAPDEGAYSALLFCNALETLKTGVVLLCLLICAPAAVLIQQRIHAMESKDRDRKDITLLLRGLFGMVVVDLPLGAAYMLWGDMLPDIIEYLIVLLMAFPVCVVVMGYLSGRLGGTILFATICSVVTISAILWGLNSFYYQVHCTTSGPVFKG